MKSIYDYENNINIVTTPNGDKVITMNEAILTEICNLIWMGGEYQSSKGLNASADNTLKLWETLVQKREEGMGE